MQVNVKNYEELLTGITVLEVSGESCANCLTLMPLLYNLVSKRNDCKLLHLEATEETLPLIHMFEIEAVPSILIMNDKKVFARCRGYQPEEILELWLDAKLEELKNGKNCLENN